MFFSNFVDFIPLRDSFDLCKKRSHITLKAERYFFFNFKMGWGW